MRSRRMVISFSLNVLRLGGLKSWEGNLRMRLMLGRGEANEGAAYTHHIVMTCERWGSLDDAAQCE